MDKAELFCSKTKKWTSKSTKPKVYSNNRYERMNTMRYKKQSKETKHQRKEYYIIGNSKGVTTWNINLKRK